MSNHGTPESRPDPPSSSHSEDLNALSAIMAESLNPSGPERFDPAVYAEYLRAVLDNPHAELIIVRDYGGRPAGSLTVLLNQEAGCRIAWIYDVVVTPAEQDRNYGEVLVGLATDWASYRGANPVVLDTRPNLGKRHRPGEPRPFDPHDPGLLALGHSKGVEYGRQASFGIDLR